MNFVGGLPNQFSLSFYFIGDFAVLINQGMSIKSAIVYNLISAVLAYLGLAIGILAGNNEMGRHFILSLTAGLFLYVSLADMVSSLKIKIISRYSKESLLSQSILNKIKNNLIKKIIHIKSMKRYFRYLVNFHVSG